MRLILACLLGVVVTACSPSATIEKGLTSQERGIFRGAIDDISRGDSASLSSRVPPQIASKIPSAMQQMRRAMPAPPLDVSLTNADWNIGREPASSSRGLSGSWKVRLGTC